MNIFGSLGSNYSVRLALRHVSRQPKTTEIDILTSVLKTKFGGRPYLFYKGREALTAGLLSLDLPPDSQVLVTGFTCWVVYRAVLDAGLNPVLCDIAPNDVNPHPSFIREHFTKNPKIKAVIIQNTYGFPVDMGHVTKIAQEFKAYVIEDLAHSVGARYGNGADAGQVGDITCLSFSQDKILDAVSGGALIIRNPAISLPVIRRKQIPFSHQQRERFYPILTTLIRNTYPFGGKFIHALVRKLQLLSTPLGYENNDRFRQFPPENAALALTSIHANPGDILRRQKIAAGYVSQIRKEFLISGIIPRITDSSCIRFPIRVPYRDLFLKRLDSRGIHISDTWYDAPVAPKRYLVHTKYSGECPNGEALSESVVNLPTHRGISDEKAKLITREVNQWKP